MMKTAPQHMAMLVLLLLTAASVSSHASQLASPEERHEVVPGQLRKLQQTSKPPFRICIHAFSYEQHLASPILAVKAAEATWWCQSVAPNPAIARRVLSSWTRVKKHNVFGLLT